MFRYYVIAILVCMVLIFTANAIFVTPLPDISNGDMLMFLVIGVAVAFAADAIAALFTRYALPKSFFDPTKKRYKSFGWEKRFYGSIGIRKWKDKIPETGGLLVGFSKSKATDLRNNEYVFKFMEETCYAEVMHVWSIPLGFVTLLLCPAALRLTVALPVAVVNAVLQLLPVMVQRFVRPQLMRVYLGNLKRQQNQKKSAQ